MTSIKSNLAENILTTPLNKIGVNPFVNRIKFGKFDYFKIYIFGSLLCIIRIIPMLLFFLLSAIVAKFFWTLQCFLQLAHIPVSNRLKNIMKWIVFALIRTAFFFAGFYWVKVTDKSGGTQPSKPNIIPVAPHSTFFDVILLIKLGVPAIVSRYENSKMFLVGTILKLCEPVYVQRDSKASRNKAAEDIKQRGLIGKLMIFPEGTCTDRIALIQFKMGAFLPQLPVQPVVIKWNIGKQDYLSWTEEGPGIRQIVFYTLGRIATNCEIIKLPAYKPNEEEKADARLFADNVTKVMCDELGVLQSFYSYDDIMFMGFANEIRLFRSPVCIKLLKVCYKIATENTNASHKLSKKIKDPKLAPIFSPRYLGFGEDFEHSTHIPNFYIPKVILKIAKKKTISKPVKQQNTDHLKRLPLSGVFRLKRTQPTAPQIAVTSDVANEKRLVYETFCNIVEKSINELEEKAEIRPIQSTKDLAQLLGLDKFPNTTIMTSSSLVDLLKAIEFSTTEGPTTLHLLIALHLCDCREPNLWQRIRASMILLSANRKKYNLVMTKNKAAEVKSEPINKPNPVSINMHQFKTLLWYSLGLQEFNDCFFIQQNFDFEYIKNNLKRIFSRAVDENAQHLEEHHQ